RGCRPAGAGVHAGAGAGLTGAALTGADRSRSAPGCLAPARSPRTPTDRSCDNGPVSPRAVVLLGSTGSVGTQAVDVVRRSGDRFRVVGLAGGGGDVALLARQAVELGVEVVGVARASAEAELREALRAAGAASG